MEEEMTKWVKKMLANTVREIGETKDMTRMINLGGKLKAYKDCLEFINAHKTPKK